MSPAAKHAAEIRRILKSAGYNARKVSVRGSMSTHSSTVDVTLKADFDSDPVVAALRSCGVRARFFTVYDASNRMLDAWSNF